MTSAIGKYIHKHFLLHHPFFNTSVDSYLKWIPFASVFLLDLFDLKTKSGWKKQVLLAGSIEAIRYCIADNLKKIAHEHRPAPYFGNHSFPSGHTSSSFAGAEFMRSELKESLPLLSCAGYVGATATAVIRLMKSRHWLIDVVAGAAVGILSTRLIYFVMNRIENRKKEKVSNVQEVIGDSSSADVKVPERVV
jgi:membrane-associated phospholipid phosphatase